MAQHGADGHCADYGLRNVGIKRISVSHILSEVLNSLKTIERKIDIMSTTVAEVQSAITQLSSDVTTLLTDVASQVAALNASITALQGVTAPDLSGPLAAVQALDATVQTAITTYAPTPPAAVPASTT